MRLRIGLFVLLTVLLPVGCRQHGATASSSTGPALAGDVRDSATSRNWVDTKLYFGLGPADHPGQGVSDADWRAFLDAEVTPRFPSGFSVVDVYGQWQGKSQRHVERLRSKMLVIVCVDSTENRAKIEAIRTAWKQKTGDESVLRVTEPVDVSF